MYTSVLALLLTVIFAFLGNYPVVGMIVVLLFARLGFYFRTSEAPNVLSRRRHDQQSSLKLRPVGLRAQ